jgi:hypothetical protein
MDDTELPEFIDQDVLSDVSSVEVPDQALLGCFMKVDKPFLSKSTVAEMSDLGGEAVRKRLNSLVKRDVLSSAPAGKQTRIYWLNRPESDWPVPDDLDRSLSDDEESARDTVAGINRLTTFTLLNASIFASLYVLDWLSGFRMTDGIFEISLSWEIMPALAFVLLAVLFYIALQTSLVVENDDAGWPTIRRVYRKVAQ